MNYRFCFNFGGVYVKSRLCVAITKTATVPENPRVNATITLMNNFNRLEIIRNAIKLGDESIALQAQRLPQDAGDMTTLAAVRGIYV